MKRYLTRAGWILIILLCVGATFPAHMIIMEWEHESQGQILGNYYSFDPKKIFESSRKGERNLFSVLPNEEVDKLLDEDLKEYPPSKWKTQDFLETLYMFHLATFDKPLKEKFRAATFQIPDCSQVSSGPQKAKFFTYEVSLLEGVTNYSYFIDPQNHYLNWDGDYFKPIISWPISSLDFAKNRISAEQALEIAEKFGGQNTRLANNNQCQIDIDISANDHSKNWVVSYNSTVDPFTTLLSMEIDKDTGEYKVLAKGGVGFYAFDSQSIIKSLSKGETDVFKSQTGQPEHNLNMPPVAWTQEDYYQIAKAFNKVILNEDLDKWDIESISFELDCDDAIYGLQQMRFSFVQLNLSDKEYFVQDINIIPRMNIIEWSNEYDYSVLRPWLDERSREVIDQSWLNIAADVAMATVYEAEGKNLHLALENSNQKCYIKGWLSNPSGIDDANSLEWNISEWRSDTEQLPLGQSAAHLQAFVNVKTGALKIFKFYENLKQ